jgi:major membrane immunogen (membrane-anchored lipoprotein)
MRIAQVSLCLLLGSCASPTSVQKFDAGTYTRARCESQGYANYPTVFQEIIIADAKIVSPVSCKLDGTIKCNTVDEKTLPAVKQTKDANLETRRAYVEGCVKAQR